MRILVQAVLAAVLAGFVARLVHASPPVDLVENTKALSAFLHVYGAIYGTMIAFLIFVVWGQFNGAEAGIAREGKTLVELAALCRAGRHQGCAEALEAIQTYGKVASEGEWSALAVGKALPAADQAFLAIQTAVLKSTATTEAEELTREVIIRVAERAATLRAERIALSVTRIPHTLWRTLVFATGLLCLSVALLGADSLMSGYITTGLTLMVVLILGVIADMDNPFFGVYNASKEPLERLRHL
jgi:hypothetical protein